MSVVKLSTEALERFRKIPTRTYIIIEQLCIDHVLIDWI